MFHCGLIDKDVLFVGVLHGLPNGLPGKECAQALDSGGVVSELEDDVVVGKEAGATTVGERIRRGQLFKIREGTSEYYRRSTI